MKKTILKFSILFIGLLTISGLLFSINAVRHLKNNSKNSIQISKNKKVETTKSINAISLKKSSAQTINNQSAKQPFFGRATWFEDAAVERWGGWGK